MITNDARKRIKAVWNFITCRYRPVVPGMAIRYRILMMADKNQDATLPKPLPFE